MAIEGKRNCPVLPSPGPSTLEEAAAGSRAAPTSTHAAPFHFLTWMSEPPDSQAMKISPFTGSTAMAGAPAPTASPLIPSPSAAPSPTEVQNCAVTASLA